MKLQDCFISLDIFSLYQEQEKGGGGHLLVYFIQNYIEKNSNNNLGVYWKY